MDPPSCRSARLPKAIRAKIGLCDPCVEPGRVSFRSLKEVGDLGWSLAILAFDDVDPGARGFSGDGDRGGGCLLKDASGRGNDCARRDANHREEEKETKHSVLTIFITPHVLRISHKSRD